MKKQLLRQVGLPTLGAGQAPNVSEVTEEHLLLTADKAMKNTLCGMPRLLLRGTPCIKGKPAMKIPSLPLQRSWVDILKKGQLSHFQGKSNRSVTFYMGNVHGMQARLSNPDDAPNSRPTRPTTPSYGLYPCPNTEQSGVIPPAPAEPIPEKSFKMHYMEPGPVTPRGVFVIPPEIENVGA